MKVRYAVGLNLDRGLAKELDIDDLSEMGIETVELKWTRYDVVTTHQSVCGFEDIKFLRDRRGGIRDRRKVVDSEINFFPNAQGTGYAYMPKTEKNMLLLAGSYADNAYIATDKDVIKEVYALCEKHGFDKERNTRDTALDAVLRTKRESENILKKNEELKKQIALAEAAKENEDLERKLAELTSPTPVKKVVKKAETKVVEPVVAPVEPEPVVEVPTVEDFEDDDFAEDEVDEAVVEETPKPQRPKIDTSKMKHKK